MIRKHKDMRSEILEKLKNGNGCVKIVNILERSELYGCGRLFCVTEIPPGGSIGAHTHSNDFEVYFILHGIAEINDNGVRRILKTGDAAQCRLGEFHSIKNIGDQKLKYLAVILNSAEK